MTKTKTLRLLIENKKNKEAISFIEENIKVDYAFNNYSLVLCSLKQELFDVADLLFEVLSKDYSDINYIYEKSLLQLRDKFSNHNFLKNIITLNVNSNIETVLEICCRFNNFSFVYYITEHHEVNYNKASLLNIIGYSMEYDNVKSFDYFLEKIDDIDKHDFYYILVNAIKNNKYYFAKRLLRKGALNQFKNNTNKLKLLYNKVKTHKNKDIIELFFLEKNMNKFLKMIIPKEYNKLQMQYKLKKF